MVEHTTHNRVVGGSNPPTATSLLDSLRPSHLLDPAGMLVALSGGPDSTALLLGLLEVGIKVKAAHFDHALRPESAAEALTVADFCRAHGVELVSGIRRAPLAKGSLQATARAARYRFLEEASAASGLATVALGHTADDLVEGAILHLLRGAGLAGMRGMPERRGPFVRPLLEVWRAQVEEFLADRSVIPLRDPSNLDRRFARVRVRLDLLPRLEMDRPGLTRRIHAAARRAADLQKGLEAEADGLAAAGARSAPLARLGEAPAAVRAETFRRLHAAASGRAPGLQRLRGAGRRALQGRGQASTRHPPPRAPDATVAGRPHPEAAGHPGRRAGAPPPPRRAPAGLRRRRAGLGSGRRH